VNKIFLGLVGLTCIALLNGCTQTSGSSDSSTTTPSPVASPSPTASPAEKPKTLKAVGGGLCVASYDSINKRMVMPICYMQ
jgi:hypothetical protein